MRSTLPAAALMLVPFGTVTAQAIQPRSGSRVRITSAAHGLEKQVARVVDVRSDSLFLQVTPAETLAVARAGLTRLDVSTGRRRRTGRGATVGSLIGASSGVIIGFASGDDPPNSFWQMSAGEKAAIAGVGLGVVGLLVGATVGALTVSERWTSVPLGNASVSPGFQAGRGGARLAVSVSF